MYAQSSQTVLAAVLALATLAGLVGFAMRPAQAAQSSIFTGLVKGVAVGGYDPVSYFTDGKAGAGNPEITLMHEGATWRFASVEHRDAFAASPDRYAPRYGGYCAYAVAMGYTAKGDPEAWSVVDGRLYLNFNEPTKKEWEKDIPGYIAKADKNWPGVLEK
jgi:hypothetical protein